MVFVVQLNKEQNKLEFVIDYKALSLLQSIVNREWYEPKMKINGGYDLDHEHLASKECGGNELTPEHVTEGFIKIEDIKIIYIGKDGEKLIT